MQYPGARHKDRYKIWRCYWYHDDGRPIERRDGGKGCLEPSYRCNFAHPGEPEWDTAQPATRDPPKFYTLPVHLHPPPRPSFSPGPVPPSPYGLPPPPQFRRDRVPSSSVGGHDEDVDMNPPRMPRALREQSRGHSPAPSIASSAGRRGEYIANGVRAQDESRDRQDEWHRHRDDDRRRGDERRYEEHSREQERRRDSGDYHRDGERRREDPPRDRRSRSSSRTRRPSTSEHRRPSDAYDREAAPAPPAPKKDLTEEEKRMLWHERVKVLAQAVQTRVEQVRFYEETQKYERLLKSVTYETLPEEERAALQQLKSTAAARFRETQQELNRIAGKLIPEEFWPFAQRAQMTSDPGYQRMTDVVAVVRGEVESLHAAISNFHAAGASATAASAAAASSSTSAMKPEPGEIVAGPPSDGSRKRRRLTTEGGAETAGFTPAELEQMQDRLATLAHRIAEVQNEMLQFDRQVAEEVEAQLDYRLSNLRIDAGGRVDKPADADLVDRVDTLRKNLKAAQAREAEITSVLAQLKVEEEERDKQHAALQEQNNAIRQQLEELKGKQEQSSGVVTTQTEEIAALRDVITALAANTYNPPLPPPSLTADEIVQAVRPRILDETRGDLTRALDEGLARIRHLLQEQSKQVNGDLRTHMAPVIRSIEWISAWVERIRAVNGAPLTATAPTIGTPTAATTTPSIATLNPPTATTPTFLPSAPSTLSSGPSTSTDKGKGVAR
ncbi:hypothetical protein C8Q77DRAFT_1094546 [Trametes polyzona]|nr:hypothetical protein C8Q77DRAFT_1094546 [Trametes polyzona]